MQMSCGCGSSAPAAGSASTNARRARSTSAASDRRRKKAISWHCSEPLPVQTGRSVFRERCTSLSQGQPGEKAGVARERRLGAREVEQIFAAFAEAMRELPPDIEAGWLDAQGDLRLAPDIARKLRTARRVRQLLQELRQRDNED